MHYYIILDQGTIPTEKFERLHTELQALLAEFKIIGELARVTPLRTVADLLETAVQRGARTVIACGSDHTFNLLLAALKGREITVGFIPLEPEQSYLSTILGLGSLTKSIKTIAARRIEKLDLAQIAGNIFISFVEFGIMSMQLKNTGWWNSLKLLSQTPSPITIRVDNSYTVSTMALGGLAANVRSAACRSPHVATPTDGHLDLLILEKLSKSEVLRYRNTIAEGCLELVPNSTVIKCRKIDFLEPRGLPLTMLGRVVAKFPTTVEIIPERLTMIVGKDRMF